MTTGSSFATKKIVTPAFEPGSIRPLSTLGALALFNGSRLGGRDDGYINAATCDTGVRGQAMMSHANEATPHTAITPVPPMFFTRTL